MSVSTLRNSAMGSTIVMEGRMRGTAVLQSLVGVESGGDGSGAPLFYEISVYLIL